jgi:ubiquitin-protein ligase
MTNTEIKNFMEEEESLWAIAYFRVMESVFKNALFCESIKINHNYPWFSYSIIAISG